MDSPSRDATITPATQPVRVNPIEIAPTHAEPHGDIPNTPFFVSLIAFALGSTFSLGLIIFCLGGLQYYWWTTYQLGFFCASWALFHYLEFAVTAIWNRERCSVDSFLLNNGISYHIANAVALTEYLITLYFKPSAKSYWSVSVTGVIVTILGQALRSTAMIHASTNFSHAIAFKKVEGHVLVTNGVYSWFRHPSYAAFFYWGLGTQLVLQNPISFAGYAIVMWRFFQRRIQVEERYLTRFFGQDYTRYRSRVRTWIPYI